MAYPVLFDTLAFAKKLESNGIPAQQAEAYTMALAEVLAEVLEKRVAIKEETKSSAQSLSSEISKLSHEIKLLDQKIDSKSNEIKADIIKWVFGIVLAQSAFLLSALKFLH